jgi:hypothetical protein
MSFQKLGINSNKNKNKMITTASLKVHVPQNLCSSIAYITSLNTQIHSQYFNCILSRETELKESNSSKSEIH